MDNNKPLRATLIYIIFSFLQKTIGVISIPLFTRMMEPAAFGIFSVYSSWLTVLTVFISLNFGWDSIFNGFRDFENEKDELINSIQFFSLLTTAFYFIVIIF